jgi:hypothetical protein
VGAAGDEDDPRTSSSEPRSRAIPRTGEPVSAHSSAAARSTARASRPVITGVKPPPAPAITFAVW